MAKANPKGSVMPHGYKRKAKRANMNNGPPSKNSHPTAKYAKGKCGWNNCPTDAENKRSVYGG